MRSQLFRTLIQSLLAASLPLAGSSGCDVCASVLDGLVMSSLWAGTEREIDF